MASSSLVSPKKACYKCLGIVLGQISRGVKNEYEETEIERTCRKLPFQRIRNEILDGVGKYNW